jgi:hypothetical protein
LPHYGNARYYGTPDCQNGRQPSRIESERSKMCASLREMREELLTKMQTNEDRMDAKIYAARIEDSNMKFEILRGTLPSRIKEESFQQS